MEPTCLSFSSHSLDLCKRLQKTHKSINKMITLLDTRDDDENDDDGRG